MYRLFDFLGKALIIISGICLLLMMLNVTFDVIFKYFLHKPIPGTAEVVASYYMVATVFFPLAYIELKNSFISVQLFYNKFSLGVQKFLDILGVILSFVFYAYLSYETFKKAIESYKINEYIDGIWNIIIWPSRFIIPLGCLVACLVLLLKLFGKDARE